jgi:hypothetical protein
MQLSEQNYMDNCIHALLLKIILTNSCFFHAAALLASDLRGDVVQRQRINWQSHVRRLH